MLRSRLLQTGSRPCTALHRTMAAAALRQHGTGCSMATISAQDTRQLACSSSGPLLSPSPRLRLVHSRGGVAAAAAATGSSEEFDYDLFTIGAGSGGVRGSRMASQFGAKVAVCELAFDYISSDSKGGVGGTCVLRGCVPKKLMVYASEYADLFKQSAAFGWETNGQTPPHTWTKFMEAKRKELQRLNGAYKNTLNNAKVTLMEGRGKVLGPNLVEVDGKQYKARNILIAVGNRAIRPPIPGAEHCITSDEILELKEQPKKMVIVGGGYIAVEFGSIFNRFGCEVHTVWRQSLPLRGFDEECRRFINEQYQLAGLNLYPDSSPTEIKKQDNGKLTVIVKRPDGHTTVIEDNDQVLLATGRGPNTKGLGLEEAGVKLGEKGEVIVDEYSRTNVPSIWAIGDVTNRVQLTPVALMEGTALAKTIALNQPTKPDYWAIPSAVFSNPELANVGLTEEQARKKHKNVDIYTTSFRPMRNTISGSPLKTFMKLVVDADTDTLVGAHMVGEHAAEIMQGLAVCVKVGVKKSQLDSTVGIHPSSAEELVTMRTVTRRIRNGEEQKEEEKK